MVDIPGVGELFVDGIGGHASEIYPKIGIKSVNDFRKEQCDAQPLMIFLDQSTGRWSNHPFNRLPLFISLDLHMIHWLHPKVSGLTPGITRRPARWKVDDKQRVGGRVHPVVMLHREVNSTCIIISFYPAKEARLEKSGACKQHRSDCHRRVHLPLVPCRKLNKE